MNPAQAEREADAVRRQPTAWDMFLIWARVSISSFGGGVATLGLIRQEFVDRQGWLTEEEFLRDWSLCQLAPGINLIAMTILIGRRMGGAAMVFAALVGLLFPAGVATLLVTAAYAHFVHSSFVKAARFGIVPAVAGVGLATVWSMLIPIAKRHRTSGVFVSLFYAGLLVGCFVAERIYHVSPVEVVLGSGAIGALFQVTQPKSSSP